MVRLIDADAFLERFEAMCETKTDSVISMVVRGALADEPTAYEVNKVVEKLEEVKNKDTEIALDEAQKERCFWYAQGINRAIEIVKGGGVDE